MGEHRLYGELTKASERYGSEVYRKIRVADVVDIELLSTRELGSFALKAHFDFVVSTTLHVPEFALEFDDLGHIGTKDDTKDQICREAGLTLFRVRDSIQRARFQKLHFVGYLVHFWHHALEFKRMKEFGEVAPFDHTASSKQGGFCELTNCGGYEEKWRLRAGKPGWRPSSAAG